MGTLVSYLGLKTSGFSLSSTQFNAHLYALCLWICRDTFFSYSASSSKCKFWLKKISFFQYYYIQSENNMKRSKLTDKKVTKIAIWILIGRFSFAHFRRPQIFQVNSSSTLRRSPCFALKSPRRAWVRFHCRSDESRRPSRNIQW